jgi:hypothetical protein
MNANGFAGASQEQSLAASVEPLSTRRLKGSHGPIHDPAKTAFGCTRMELIVLKPTDMAHPKPVQFDGPLSELLALMLEGPAEEVPGFNTMSERGAVWPCRAFSHADAKQNGLPVNSTATGLWHIALKRQGLERGLRRADGSLADWLAGNVVVVFDEPEARSN